MKVTISRLHFPVTTLGYGKRIGVWFQGCSIACKGCISTDTWPNDPQKRIEIEALYPLLSEWLPDADGVTISGGEPFEQPEALLALLQFFSKKSQQQIAKPFSVFVYSGYSLDKLQPQLEVFKEQGLIDAIMTDPFEESQAQTKPLRGSDNQHLSIFTLLGQQHFGRYGNESHPQASVDKTLDMMSSDDQVWLAGVPLQQDLPKLIDKLQAQGHQARATQKHSRTKYTT